MKPRRKIAIEYDDLDELAGQVHPRNPKRHDLPALGQSIARVGYIDPIIRNDRDGLVLSGEGRINELLLRRSRGEAPPPGIELGEGGAWRVPTVHGVGLDADDAVAYLVAANRIVELGGWDESRLAETLAQLVASANGLDAVGFSLSDLEKLVADLGRDRDDQQDPDAVPEPPGTSEIYVSRGQSYDLGLHRVRCGDATDACDVDRLLGGERVDLAVTDPPYNVDYGRHGGASGGRVRTIANDALDPVAWREFVDGWANQLLRVIDGAIYVFMSSREWPIMCEVLRENGAHWSDTIIWSKDQFTLGRADYQHQFEPIWYGWKERGKHHWCGDRDQGDVWFYPRPHASLLHPTMKPVGLIEHAIANSSPRGGLVLDLFGGSGSTILAAERQGRRCYAMELEPAYVQVIIERWQRYTGRTAQLREE